MKQLFNELWLAVLMLMLCMCLMLVYIITDWHGAFVVMFMWMCYDGCMLLLLFVIFTIYEAMEHWSLWLALASSRLGIEPKTPGWLVQDPTTRPTGDLIPTIGGFGAHPGRGFLYIAFG